MWGPLVAAPEELAERLAASPAGCCGGGDGSLRFRGRWSPRARRSSRRGTRRTGWRLVTFARWPRGSSRAAGRDQARYLRRPDAEVWREQRDREHQRRLTARPRAARAPAGVRRSARSPGHRAALLHDAVVAGDVRARALQAVLDPSRDHGSQGPLTGDLVCSRYADVWHLMNIAVTPESRRARKSPRS